MYRIEIPDSTTLFEFLELSDSDWVNVVATEHTTQFICDSAEIFSILQYQSVRANSDTNLAFRVNKQTIKTIACSGILEITASADKINFTFMNDSTHLSAMFPYHQAFTASFNDKIKVIQQFGDDVFDASGLTYPLFIARTFKTYFEVEANTAAIIARNGTRVFYKTFGVPDLCLTVSSASALFKCSATWGKFQNYVFALDDNLCVLVNMSRGSGVPAYELIEADKAGAAAIVKFDVTEILQMAKGLPKSNIILNLRAGECKFEQGDTVFTIPFTATEMRLSDKYSGELHLNGQTLIDVLQRLPDREICVSVKQYFNKIECGNAILLEK